MRLVCAFGLGGMWLRARWVAGLAAAILLSSCDLFQPLPALEPSAEERAKQGESATAAGQGEELEGASPIPPEALLKSERGGGSVEEGVSAEQLEVWLKAHVAADQRNTPARARLETISEGARWRVVFPDRLLAPDEPVEVQVVRHKAMTVMAAPLLVLPKSAPSELLGSLMVQNFDLYQSKLSLGPGNRLFVSYEVPNRLLDEQELGENLEDLSFLAQKLTGLLEQRLIETALGGGSLPNPGAGMRQGMAPPNFQSSGGPVSGPDSAALELGPAHADAAPPWPVPPENGSLGAD